MPQEEVLLAVSRDNGGLIAASYRALKACKCPSQSIAQLSKTGQVSNRGFYCPAIGWWSDNPYM